jgi:ATP/maltotriose-dependent transcriptional regulator MalT
LFRASLLAQRGYYEEAAAAFESGLQECQQCADPAAIWGYLGLAELDALLGDIAGAFARIDEAERLMHYSHISVQLYQGLVLLTKAKLWLSQGRHAHVEKVLRQQLGEITQLPPFGAPELNVRLRLLLAQAQLAGSELGEALRSLAAIKDKALDEGRRQLACEAGFVLAQGLYAANRQPQAKQLLLDVLAMARQLGLVSIERAFLQGNPAMAQWAGEPGSQDGVPAALLTRREREVLKLIAQGYANQQIADALFISLHTVKTHAQRINAKLGVERRTQAILRAKELGLND